LDALLGHVFKYAESYTVCLVWVAVPLGFIACYLRFTGALQSAPVEEEKKDGRH
jgi:hypothetical protein